MRSVVYTVLLVLAQPAVAGSWWFGVGGGGSLQSGAISLGIRSAEWGGSISIVNVADYASEEVQDYPIPHRNYSVEEEEAYLGNAVGLDVTRHYQIDGQHSWYWGVGFYAGERCTVVRSNVTGIRYCNQQLRGGVGSLDIGYEYRSADRVIGLGYYSARGIELRFGKRW